MAVDIYSLIREKMPTFSKGQKRIASAILEDYDKTAYMTAAKLGQTVGVSESTVVRFATELGFEGYPEFQHAVQEMVRAKLTPNQRIEVSSARMGGANLFARVIESEVARLRYTQENLDLQAFSGAVDAINSANRIYIMGVRSTSSLASFLHLNLSMICKNVCLVHSRSSSEIFEQILDIQAGDVLIAISFPRYSARVEKAAKYAASREATVIALTDSPLSPIAAPANYLLEAQSDMVSYVDSLVAPFAVANALLAAVANKRPDAVRERLESLERIWDEYDVYTKR